jgi:hypothetical protein
MFVIIWFSYNLPVKQFNIIKKIQFSATQFNYLIFPICITSLWKLVAQWSRTGVPNLLASLSPLEPKFIRCVSPRNRFQKIQLILQLTYSTYVNHSWISLRTHLNTWYIFIKYWVDIVLMASLCIAFQNFVKPERLASPLTSSGVPYVGNPWSRTYLDG